MSTYRCENGCCILKINKYVHTKTHHSNKRKKAGVFIYDPEIDKVLLVQSRGHLWGPPKGTLEKGETDRLCAIREVKEETGLVVSDKDFSKATTINNRAIYYYLEMSYCDVHVQDHIINNDANGIGWIKTECLEKCLEKGDMLLSKHCIQVIKRFRDKTFTNLGGCDIKKVYRPRYHCMYIYEPWFSLIKAKKKLYEGRRFWSKTQRINVGDIIIVTSKGTAEKITVYVTSFRRFKSFRDALTELPINEVLRDGLTIDECCEIYSKNVSYKTQEQDGVCMIGIKIKN